MMRGLGDRFRRGGETGVKEVQLLEGDAARAAVEDGRIPRDLINAAMQAERSAGMQRRPGLPYMATKD